MGECWKSFRRSPTLEEVDLEKLVEGPPLGRLSRPGRLPGTETVGEVLVLVSLRIEIKFQTLSIIWTLLCWTDDFRENEGTHQQN